MKARDRRSFTLIEMLIAVAILGALLLAMNIFIFSMGEIWGRNNEKRLFDQHVRAVTRHVETLMRSAALSPVSLGRGDRPVGPREIRVGPGASEVLLAFELPEGDRVLPWPEVPLPDVVCALGMQEGVGLVLYWHSRLEKGFATATARHAVLTPFGSGLGYEYYEPELKIWRSGSGLQQDREGKWLAPDRMTLRFAHGDMKAETTVALPVPGEALPPF